MARLLSTAEVVGLSLAHCFIFITQRGSHLKYRDDNGHTVIVTAGRREMPQGTLASIIRQSGLPKELFN
jgi:predicted RNA binding protein YcfA (HicA-like mRNA interferase family)